MGKKSVGRPSNGRKTKVQLFLLDAFIAGRKSPEVANEINEWYLGNTKLGNKVIRNTPEIELGNTKLTDNPELPTTKLTNKVIPNSDNKVIPNSEHGFQAVESNDPELKAELDSVYGTPANPAFTPNYVKNVVDMTALHAIASGNTSLGVIEHDNEEEFITAPRMGNRDADKLVNRFIDLMRRGASVANCTYALDRLEESSS